MSDKTCELIALCDPGFDWLGLLHLIFATAAWSGVFIALTICWHIYQETK